jgi:hypothetical protein
MKNYITCCYLLLSSYLFAQGANSVGQERSFVNRIQAMQKFSEIPTFNLGEVSVEGSKFFYEEYCDGELLMTKDRLFKMGSGYKYRVDESLNQINSLTPKGQELALLNEEVVYLKLLVKGKEAYFINATTPEDDKKERILQILYVGKTYQLLKLAKKQVTRLTRTQGLSDKTLVDKYSSNPHYFLKVKEGYYTEIKLKKKDLIESIPSKKNQLTRMFDTNEKYDGKMTEPMLVEIIQSIDNQ